MFDTPSIYFVAYKYIFALTVLGAVQVSAWFEYMAKPLLVLC